MNNFRVSLLVLASVLSTAAAAQGYVGVAAGRSRVDFDCSGTTSCDRSGSALKIFGGYMFGPNLGV